MIADKVIIPKGIKPGHYVLGCVLLPLRCACTSRNALSGHIVRLRLRRLRFSPTTTIHLRWRNDCEETAQVWQNCGERSCIKPSVLLLECRPFLSLSLSLCARAVTDGTVMDTLAHS